MTNDAVAVSAVAIACVLALQACAVAARAWLRRLRARARVRRALRGEARAARWLERAGFAVLGAQVAVDYDVWVDGVPSTIALRADYLVERGGLRYVAEVKTGRAAPRIETPATRRQLLEYRVAFDVDGVVLVDGDSGEVRLVRFPLGDAAPARAAGAGWIAWGFVAALAFAAARAWPWW